MNLAHEVRYRLDVLDHVARNDAIKGVVIKRPRGPVQVAHDVDARIREVINADGVRCLVWAAAEINGIQRRLR